MPAPDHFSGIRSLGEWLQLDANGINPRWLQIRETLPAIMVATFRSLLGARAPIALEVGSSVLVSGLLVSHYFGPGAGLLSLLGVNLGLYFQDRPRRERLLRLPAVGIGLVIASLAGVLTARQPLLAVLAMIATSLLAAWLATSWRTGPPGALMFAIAFGVCGYAAGKLASSAHLPEPVLIASWVAVGALVAYLAVALPLLWLRNPAMPRVGLQGNAQIARTANPDGYVILARMLVATVLAGALGLLLDLDRTYWVIQTVVAVLLRGSDWQATQRRAWHRVAGTVLGIAVFWLLAVASPGTVLLFVLLALLQVATELVITRHYGLALTFITPMALMASWASATQSWQALGATRFADTLLGAVIALAGTWLANRVMTPRHSR